MIVKEFDIEHLPEIKHEGKRHKWGMIPKIISDFIDSNHDCVEVIDDEKRFANSNNMRKAFKDYILKHNIKTVNAIIRGDRVFLIWGKKNEM